MFIGNSKSIAMALTRAENETTYEELIDGNKLTGNDPQRRHKQREGTSPWGYT